MKDRRGRLLKDRPSVRRCDVQNLRDLGIIWADYLAGNFKVIEPGLDNEEFLSRLLNVLAVWDSVWFVEDKSKHYGAGVGPVSILGVKTDGWRIEPHLHHFSWSSTRQKLRAWVAVLQMLRHDRDVGVIFVLAEAKDKKFFDHVARYGVLFPKGLISGGLPIGDGVLYILRGKKQCLGFRS